MHNDEFLIVTLLYGYKQYTFDVMTNEPKSVFSLTVNLQNYLQF